MVAINFFGTPCRLFVDMIRRSAAVVLSKFLQCYSAAQVRYYNYKAIKVIDKPLKQFKLPKPVFNIVPSQWTPCLSDLGIERIH